MIVCRSLDELPPGLSGTAVTIGNFDGVHLGHREIFRRLKREAAAIGGPSAVVTFHPHPLKLIRPHRPLRLINTLEEKVTLIEASGVDYLVIIPFDATVAALGAAEFVERVLVGRLGVRRLVIGYDYAFGRGREGDGALLRQLGERFGFDVVELAPIAASADTVHSSSLVRRLIADGDVAGVIGYLGRNFSVAGRVVHGRHRGRQLGFPTANLATDKELVPADGVYAVKVKVDDRLYDGACNVGTTPTFGEAGRSIEVHLFDFDGDLYDRELRVYFVERLRGERRFESPAALAEAIAADVARCREILATAQLVVYHEYLGDV